MTGHENTDIASAPGLPMPLVRGKSSSSLKEENKKRQVKKFTAGKVTALNRNNSFGKNLNKLTRITSLEAQTNASVEDRPKMNRSKSSDLVLTKSFQRSRSGNKLNTLASSKKSSTNLFNHPLNRPRSRNKVVIELSDNREESDEEEEEEVEDFDDNAKVLQLETRVEDTPEPESPEDSPQPEQYKDQAETIYNPGFLLSQSTGVERPLMNTQNLVFNNKVSQAGDYFGLSQRKPAALSRLSSRGSLPQTPAESLSNQSSQLIFQQSSTGLAKEISHHDRMSDKASIKDFSDFLSTKSSSVETRTQQRLWLQRENALLPEETTNNALGSYVTNSQFRTEFEKFAREYLNVRRYVNPTVESLKRLENKKVKNIKTRRSQNSEGQYRRERFQKRDNEDTKAQLMKIWQRGFEEHLTRNEQETATLQKKPERSPVAVNTSLAMTQTGLSSPQAPTTRAQAARGQLARTNTAPGILNPGHQVNIGGKIVG